MNLNQFIGLDSKQRFADGTEPTHKEKQTLIIEKLGGLEAIKPYIPFTFDEIKEALATDEHLNNLSMKKWDYASGFVSDGQYCKMIGTGIVSLYRKHGINSFSLSDGVSLLKNASILWVNKEEENNQ